MTHLQKAKNSGILLSFVFILAGALCGCNEIPYTQLLQQYYPAVAQVETVQAPEPSGDAVSDVTAEPEDYERMVAAYVLGYSITKEDLAENPHLKFAQGPDDTGVIVSWNIEGPGNKNEANIVVIDGAISINPLNWKRDDTYASAEKNLGSRVLIRDKGTYEYQDIGADAQIDLERGVVVCHADYPFIRPAQEEFAGVFGPESFHNGDYTFFYNNIRENVAERIENYISESTDEEYKSATLFPFFDGIENTI